MCKTLPATRRRVGGSGGMDGGPAPSLFVLDEGRCVHSLTSRRKQASSEKEKASREAGRQAGSTSPLLPPPRATSTTFCTTTVSLAGKRQRRIADRSIDGKSHRRLISAEKISYSVSCQLSERVSQSVSQSVCPVRASERASKLTDTQFAIGKVDAVLRLAADSSHK